MIDSNIAKIDLVCSYPKTGREFAEIVEQAARKMRERGVAITDIWMPEELAFWAACTQEPSRIRSLMRYALEVIPEAQECKGMRCDPEKLMMIFFNREGVGIKATSEYALAISDVLYLSHIFVVKLEKR